tara:strand:+ start:5497 stop:5646 length:150 start_codon:yes stop_codon:yes gene_type:complete
LKIYFIYLIKSKPEENGQRVRLHLRRQRGRGGAKAGIEEQNPHGKTRNL